MTINGATAIWSGYNHQGRVGLFVALRELNRIGGVDDLNKYRIVFELGEDFQVAHELSDGSDEIVSRHQVKAYNSTAPSQYSNVFTRHQKKNSKDELLFDDDNNPVMVEGFDAIGVPADSRFIHVIRPLDISGWQNDYGIQLYEYPAFDESSSPKLYCDFSKANGSNDEMMKLSVAEIKLATGKNDSESNLIWKDLQHNLQAKISVAHNASTFAEFTLEEMKSAIRNPEAINAYDADKSRRSILEYADDFMGEKEDVPTFTEVRKIRVTKYIQDLTTLSDESILASLRYLHINNSSFLDINSNGMKEVVYDTLSQIVSHNYEPNCIQFQKNGSSYILSVINEMKQSEGETQQGTNKWQTQKIIASLLDEDVAVVFRKAKIINKSLDADFDTLLDEQLLVSYIAGKKVYNIIEPAPLEFISVDRAVSELNSEDL